MSEKAQSVWSESVQNNRPKERHTLKGDIEADALVIGGGMAGVLIARALKEAGLSCVIAEAKTAGSGVTKNTTAKITAQHGLIYEQLYNKRGAGAALMYYDANRRAIEAFRVLARRYPCDFEEKTAYVYSVKGREKLEREARVYKKLGIAGGLTDSIPLPFQTDGALAMERQAQFNPLMLHSALAGELTIYENTFISKLKGNTAYSENGSITARFIVLATHFPLVNIPGLYFLKLYQHRSYVIALSGAPLIDGMFVDERQDGHSFRTYKDMLLIGGGDHKTGKKGGGWEELQSLAARAYPAAKEQYRWATQDCMSLDGLPYIGRHRAGNGELYVATGFNKWGMTGSMAASMLLRDLIIEGKSALESVYSPQRSMFTKQLAANALGAAAGLLSLGAPRCAHMGCKLHWNSAERSWDCSCHGSRFDKAGSVINNPAKRGIKP